MQDGQNASADVKEEVVKTPEQLELEAKAKEEADKKAAELAAKKAAQYEADLNLMKIAAKTKSEETRNSILDSLKSRFKLTKTQWDELVAAGTFTQQFVDSCIADWDMLKTYKASKGTGTRGVSALYGFPNLKKVCWDEEKKVITNQEIADVGLRVAKDLEKFYEEHKEDLAKLEAEDMYLMYYLRYAPETGEDEKAAPVQAIK